MSGHSKWATTHRQKEAVDAKRGAIFTKFGNLITIAARQGGGDLDANFKLRLAVEKARTANMPKENIERAIKRGTGEGGGATMEEAIYEIFGPGGAVFIAEIITDNKNRASSEIRSAAGKHGGRLGEMNSVLWMFNKKGLIVIEIEKLTGKKLDELELNLIDAGAEDIIKGDDAWEIYTAPDQLQTTENKIKSLGLEAKESSLIYAAKEELAIADAETQEKIEKLYNALDDLGDVNNIYTNASR